MAQLQHYKTLFMWCSDIVSKQHQKHTTLFVSTITCSDRENVKGLLQKKYIDFSAGTSRRVLKNDCFNCLDFL